ncbi:MAG: exodeoxyribonuclease III [Dehalococcoidia bacterium]|nr:exodeoxyribonuclease III [Dehalococcoidia bacterium]
MTKERKILCWNVNGIRAAVRGGFLEWLRSESPDILCLQETKASPEQLSDEVRKPHGYHVCWNHPERRGYSGVATFAREKPVAVNCGLGIPRFDAEGRVIMAEYPEFSIFNVYFPNGKRDETRLKYKLDFYDALFEFVEPLRQQGEKLIICGDFNTAHKEIDLARPKENEKFSGFLPVERAWLDKLTGHGYVDVFRRFNREPGHYTWWDLKTRARERNVGWRIDYFFVTENLLELVSDAFIMPEIMGSDHCPVGIKLRASA